MVAVVVFSQNSIIAKSYKIKESIHTSGVKLNIPSSSIFSDSDSLQLYPMITELTSESLNISSNKLAVTGHCGIKIITTYYILCIIFNNAIS